MFTHLINEHENELITHLKITLKPGTLCDQPKLMTIQLDSNFFVGCRCHRVADADFDVSDRKCIGSPTDANDAYRWIADGSR